MAQKAAGVRGATTRRSSVASRARTAGGRSRRDKGAAEGSGWRRKWIGQLERRQAQETGRSWRAAQ
jgi:hypothetical protein